MKSILNTTICLSVLLLAFSCKLDYIDTQLTDEEAIASIRLECDAPESYTIPAERAKTVSFRVTSTTPWFITGAEEVDWLTVSPLSSDVSSLSADITVRAEPNEALTDRSAVLTVQGKNTSIKHVITVTQLRTGTLEVTPCEGAFDKTGGQKPFSIKTNHDWKVTAADEWLTFSPAEGTSDGTPQTVTVQASAAQNKSIVRQTMVTVASGDLTQTFEVTQNGLSLEFVPLEEPAVDRKGGNLILDVNADIDWKVEVEGEGFSAEKLSASQVKVSATWNNRFAPRKATVTLKPVSAEYGNVSNSMEVSQGINFSFDGDCMVLDDGSVKISGSASARSRAKTIDTFRYVKVLLTVESASFAADGSFCLCTEDLPAFTEDSSCELQNQIILGGNIRLRGNGHTSKGDRSSYATKYYTVTQEELNALKTYEVDFIPDPSDNTKVKLEFLYNGTSKATLSVPSDFADDPDAAGHYWFGFANKTPGTWYIITSCDITPIAE